MAPEKEEHQGTGYAVLDLRIKHIESDIKEIKKEMREKAKENKEEFDEMNEKIDSLTSFNSRIELMFQHLTQTTEEMKENIKGIAAMAGKDTGWRALVSDIIKMIIVVLGAIGAGKFI